MMEDIFLATYRKDLRKLEALLATGVCIDATDEDGRTPLMHAVLAEDSSPDWIGCLLEHGADPNRHDFGQAWTALHFAARGQKEAIVRVLLEGGASAKEEDAFGNTPLWRCVLNASPNPAIVEMLLLKGSDPTKKNKHGVSPLDNAINMGNKKIVELLDRTAADSTTE